MVAVGSHFPGSCPAAACSCYIDDGESDGNEVNITTRARAANGDLAVAAASALEATRALTTERCPFLLARCKGVRQTLLNKKVRERRAERGEGGELSALRHMVAGTSYLLLAFTSDSQANSARTTSRWPKKDYDPPLYDQQSTSWAWPLATLS